MLLKYGPVEYTVPTSALIVVAVVALRADSDEGALFD